MLVTLYAGINSDEEFDLGDIRFN